MLSFTMKLFINIKNKIVSRMSNNILSLSMNCTKNQEIPQPQIFIFNNSSIKITYDMFKFTKSYIVENKYNKTDVFIANHEKYMNFLIVETVNDKNILFLYTAIAKMGTAKIELGELLNYQQNVQVKFNINKDYVESNIDTVTFTKSQGEIELKIKDFRFYMIEINPDRFTTPHYGYPKIKSNQNQIKINGNHYQLYTYENKLMIKDNYGKAEIIKFIELEKDKNHRVLGIKLTSKSTFLLSSQIDQKIYQYVFKDFEIPLSEKTVTKHKQPLIKQDEKPCAEHPKPKPNENLPQNPGYYEKSKPNQQSLEKSSPNSKQDVQQAQSKPDQQSLQKSNPKSKQDEQPPEGKPYGFWRWIPIKTLCWGCGACCCGVLITKYYRQDRSGSNKPINSENHDE